MTGSISREDTLACAMIYGAIHTTFTVREFTDFLQMQLHGLEDEYVDEILGDYAEEGKLRRVGPGVYARPVTA